MRFVRDPQCPQHHGYEPEARHKAGYPAKWRCVVCHRPLGLASVHEDVRTPMPARPLPASWTPWHRLDLEWLFFFDMKVHDARLRVTLQGKVAELQAKAPDSYLES